MYILYGPQTLKQRHKVALWVLPASPLSPSQGDGLRLEYEMKLTNGQSFWTQHFSADEFGKSD